MTVTPNALQMFMATIEALCLDELGRRPTWLAPDDSVGVIMLSFAVNQVLPDGTVTSAETLRAWLRDQPEAVTHRGDGPSPVPPPVPSLVRRLHAEGLTLQDDTNAPVFEVGVTAFPLLLLWRTNRPKALAYLDWMQATGVTMARALGLLDGGLPWMQGTLLPDAEYDDVLRDLLSAMAGRGLRLKLSALACCSYLPAWIALDKPAFFAHVCAVCAPYDNAICDGGNEQNFNGWSAASLARPSGVLSGRGSNGTNEAPPPNPFDQFELHARRDDKWPLMLKDIMDIQHGADWPYALPVPGGIDEMIRIDETTTAADGHGATNSPDDCFDAVAVPFGSYVVAHTSAGKSCDRPGPIAQRCVEAMVEAARLLPASARNGAYTRTGLADSPLVEQFPRWLRCYGSLRGDEAWMVAVQPRDGVLYAAQQGWRIAERFGPRGNLVRLTR